jgi:hypothetical protein
MADNTEKDLQEVQAFIYNDEVQSTLEEINNHLLPINVLEISGMGNQEIKHSNVLAWMFGDNQHQLDDQILSKFLGKVAELEGINADTDDENLKKLRHYAYFPENKRDITIKREWKHIDLLIEDKANKVVIAIENKVWAEQSEHQLKDYENVIDNEYPKKQDKENKVSWKRYYIFLTPDGRDAKMEQEQNTAQEIWLKADYQIIYNILKGIDKSNQDIPEEAKMILKSYNDLLIKENIVASQELQELCAKIWSQSKYKNALNILIKNEPNGVAEFLESLRKKLKNLGIRIIDLNKNTETYFAIETNNYKKYLEKEDIEEQSIRFGFYVVKNSIAFWLEHNFGEYAGLLKEIKEKLNEVEFNTRKLQKNHANIYIPANKIVEGIADDLGKYNLTDKNKANELSDKLIEIAKTVDNCFNSLLQKSEKSLPIQAVPCSNILLAYRTLEK